MRIWTILAFESPWSRESIWHAKLGNYPSGFNMNLRKGRKVVQVRRLHDNLLTC